MPKGTNQKFKGYCLTKVMVEKRIKAITLSCRMIMEDLARC